MAGAKVLTDVKTGSGSVVVTVGKEQLHLKIGFFGVGLKKTVK